MARVNKVKTQQSHQRTAIYCRVSTQQQTERDSLETQETRLKEYCEAKGIKEYQLYVDRGISAKDTERPSFKQLMRDIEAGRICRVVYTKSDRVSRDLKDFLDLVEFFYSHNVDFKSIDEPEFGKDYMGDFGRALFGSIAQLERRMIAARVSTDMYHRAEQGRWNGGVIPHGYTTQAELSKKLKINGMEKHAANAEASKYCPIDKALYIDHIESADIKRMFSHYLSCSSIRATTRYMNTQCRTRKGGLWSNTTIHRTLSNPVYIGMIEYGKRTTDRKGKLVTQDDDSRIILVKGLHDPIISEDIFERAKFLLGSNDGKPTKPGKTYLLSGILKCGICGGSMAGQSYKKKGGGEYSYYRCVNKMQKGQVGCTGLTLPTKDVDEVVIRELLERSKNDAFLKDKQKFIEIVKSDLPNNDVESDLEGIQKNKKLLKERGSGYIDMAADGLISKEEFRNKKEKNDRQLTQLEEEERRLREMVTDNRISVRKLEMAFDQIASFSHGWDDLDAVGKASRLKSIIKSIRASKNEKNDVDISIELYLDKVDNMYRTGRDSWRRPA